MRISRITKSIVLSGALVLAAQPAFAMKWEGAPCGGVVSDCRSGLFCTKYVGEDCHQTLDIHGTIAFWERWFG